LTMEPSSSNVSSDDSKVSNTQQPKRTSKLLSTLRFSGVPKLTGPSDGKLLDLDDWRSPKPSLAERLFPKLFRKNATGKESPKKIFRRSELKKQIQESLAARRRVDLQRRYEQYALDQEQRRDEHRSRKSLQPFVDVDLEESLRKEKINDEDKEQLQETENEQQEEEEEEEEDDDDDDDEGKQTEEEDNAESDNAEEDDEDEIASRHKPILKIESESEDEDEEQKCNDEADNEKVSSEPLKASVISDSGFTEDKATVQSRNIYFVFFFCFQFRFLSSEERITVNAEDDDCKVDDQARPTCSNLLQRRNVKSLRDLSMENIFFNDDSKPNLEDTFSFVEADAAPIKAQDSFFNPDGLLLASSSDDCKKDDELGSSNLSYPELLPLSEKLSSTGEMVLTPRSESNSTTSCTQSKLLFAESPLVEPMRRPLKVATPKCRFDADTSLEFFCSAPFASSPIVAGNYSLASGLPRRRHLPAAPSRLVFDEDAQDGFDAERMPVNFEPPFQADTSRHLALRCCLSLSSKSDILGKIDSNEFLIEENVQQEHADDAENCEQNIFGNQVLKELKKVKRSKFLDSRKKIRKEFLDTEAVLSSSDAEEDSGDDELNEYEAEVGDEDVVKSENELRMEIGKIHLKQMLDDDRQLVEMYKEALIDSRKQRKSIRERRFAWKRNANQEDEDQEGQARNADHHDNSDNEENEANTTFEKWQQERLERMRLMMEMNESAEEEILFGSDTNSRLYQFGMQALRADDSQGVGEASRKSGKVEITSLWSSLVDDDAETAAHSVIFSQSMDYHSSESLLRRSQSALETAYKCSADSNSCHDFSKNIFLPISPPKDDTPRNFNTLTPSTRKRRRLLKEQGTSTAIFDEFHYIGSKMSDERSNLNISNPEIGSAKDEAKSVNSTKQFVQSSNNPVANDLKLDSNEVQEESLPKSTAGEKAGLEELILECSNPEVKPLLSSAVESLTRPKECESEEKKFPCELPFGMSVAKMKQLLDEPNGLHLLLHYLRCNFCEDSDDRLSDFSSWTKFSCLSNDMAPFQQGIVSRSGVVVAYDFQKRQTSPAIENKSKQLTEASSTETVKVPLLRLNGMKMSVMDLSNNEQKEMEMVPILIPARFVADDNAEACILVSKGKVTVSNNVASANGISGSGQEEYGTAGNVSNEQGHVEQWSEKGRGNSSTVAKSIMRLDVDDGDEEEEEEKRPSNNVGEDLKNGCTNEKAEQDQSKEEAEEEALIVSRLSNGARLNLENNSAKRADELLEIDQLGRRLESIEPFKENEGSVNPIITYSSTEMLKIGNLKCCFVQPQRSLILNLKAFNDIIRPEKLYFGDGELEDGMKKSSTEMTRQQQKPFSTNGNSISQDIVIEHRIPTGEVHLHQDSNAWMPSWKRKNTELTAEQIETQNLMSDARMILNKMTEQTFEELAAQFVGITIRCTSVERAKMIARLMFDKAVQEPGFSEIYVKLCYRICIENFDNKGSGEQDCAKSTRAELLNLCQSQFGSIRRLYKELWGKQAALQEVEDPQRRVELESELEEESASTKRHTLGVMRLIGKLFVWKMITLTIVQQCLKNMLIEEEDIFIEHVCVLLSTMGPAFEQRISQRVGREPQRKLLSTDGIYEYLLRIARRKNVTVRIRFMIEELLQSREKWNTTIEEEEEKDAGWEEIKQRGAARQRRDKDGDNTQFFPRRQRR
ncbi:Eukaryotic translation initiation factor 4 gamma 3, partial [Trichinella zimbabwensis]